MNGEWVLLWNESSLRSTYDPFLPTHRSLPLRRDCDGRFSSIRTLVPTGGFTSTGNHHPQRSPTQMAVGGFLSLRFGFPPAVTPLEFDIRWSVSVDTSSNPFRHFLRALGFRNPAESNPASDILLHFHHLGINKGADAIWWLWLGKIRLLTA